MSKKLVSSVLQVVNRYAATDPCATDSTETKEVLRAPEGYKFTGEYRPVKANEWYFTRGYVVRCNLYTDDKYLILHPAPKPSARERRAARIQGIFNAWSGLTPPPGQIALEIEEVFAQEKG